MGLTARLEWTMSHWKHTVGHRVELAAHIHISVQCALCCHNTVTLEEEYKMCVCVCVCMRERQTDRDSDKETKITHVAF